MNNKKENIQMVTMDRVMEIFQDPKSATEDEIQNLAFTVIETVKMIGDAMIKSILTNQDSSKLH